MKRIWLLAAAIALAAGGCGDNEAPRDPLANESISFSKGGGIAGVAQEIEVSSGGSARIQVGAVDPVEKTFTVSGRTLDELNAGLDRAGFDELESPGNDPGCADCFLYELTRGDYTVTFDSVTFPEELGPVVRDLEELITRRVVSTG